MEQNRQIQKLFEIGVNLAEQVIRDMKTLSAADEDDLNYKLAMLFFFSKAYKSYQASRLLWHQGFAEDAFILTRTIFEIGLQAGYMVEDPMRRGRLFAEHDPVARHRYYLRLKELGDSDLIRAIESRQQELERLRQEHDRLKDNYPHPHNWWGESIRWLAQHLGEETYKRYVGIYWKQSNLVHSAVTSVTSYLSERPEGIQIACYPSPSDHVDIPQDATLYFLGVIAAVAAAFEVHLAAEVRRGFQQFADLVAEIGDTH